MFCCVVVVVLYINISYPSKVRFRKKVHGQASAHVWFFLTYSQSVRAKKKQKKKKEKRRKRKEEEKGDIFLFYEIHGVSQAND